MADDTKKWYTLAVACLALFMAILDNLVVNVALPTISRDLQASTTGLQWIVSAYTLVFASIQITAGGLGDRLGRKRWFLGGLALFTGASLCGALSQNIGMLIAARALQGLGAAFIMPLTLSLISVAFPPEERGRAVGIWSAISVSGLAFGPIIGGALVQYASWHWVFLINVPIGILTFILSLWFVRESRDTAGDVAFDIPGTLCITGAVASLTWALIEAGDRGWSDPFILAAFAAAAVFLGAFIAVEARVARPMVPLGFFRSRTFTGANLDSFAISFAIGGVAFFLTLYQQNVHGFSPVRAGMSLLPLVLMMMAGAPVSGALVGRLGARLLISIGMVISGAGMLLFLRVTPDSRYLDLIPAFLVLGFGNSLIFAPMTTAVLNSVESRRSGVASAVTGAVREIGTAFSIALLGTLANRVYRADYDAAPDIVAARADPAVPAAVRSVLDLIGSGASFAGRVIEDASRFPGLPAPLIAQVRDASSAAFVDGMDYAIVVSSIGVLAMGVVSYVLIRDRAAETGVAPLAPPEEEPMPNDPTPIVAPPACGEQLRAEPVPAFPLPYVVGMTNDCTSEEFTRAEATNGHAANGDVEEAPLVSVPLPAAQWQPAYGDGSNDSTPADGNAPVPNAPPGYASGWGPAEGYPFAPFDLVHGTQYPPAEPPFAPPENPPGDAFTPAHLVPADPAALDPVVEYDDSLAAPSHVAAAPIPPGNTWTPDPMTPAAAFMREDVLAARVVELERYAHELAWRPREDEIDQLARKVAALEQHTHELASRSRDDEIDQLARKVTALEETMMRFISEVPIRLGGEIGALDQRIVALSEELATRLTAESGASPETIERLDRKVMALERFAQTLPAARWHHDHDDRSEALEQRVRELEQFCATLARRGTAPREIAATAASTISAPKTTNGTAHGVPSGASRNGVSRQSTESRESGRRARR